MMKKKLLFGPLSFFLLVVLGYTYHLFSNTPTFSLYFTWNTTAYFFNKGKWDNIENIDTQTFTFPYKARSNDLLYGIPCYFKDKNFAYRNDQALFSGFDYATFQILTGIYVGKSKDLKSDILIQKQREDTCVWGVLKINMLFTMMSETLDQKKRMVLGEILQNASQILLIMMK